MQLNLISKDLGVKRVVGRGASDAVSLFRGSAKLLGARTLLITGLKNSHPDLYFHLLMKATRHLEGKLIIYNPEVPN